MNILPSAAIILSCLHIFLTIEDADEISNVNPYGKFCCVFTQFSYKVYMNNATNKAA